MCKRVSLNEDRKLDRSRAIIGIFFPVGNRKPVKISNKGR